MFYFLAFFFIETLTNVEGGENVKLLAAVQDVNLDFIFDTQHIVTYSGENRFIVR